MAHTSLDKICRSFLLGRGYTIHWYLQALLYARDCLRELTFDDLKVINYKLLTPDANNELPLPCDFLDDIGVGIRVGQLIRPLVKDNQLNSLADYDPDGKQIPYLRDGSLNNTTTSGSLSATAGWAYASFDDYGNYVGRQFGYRATYNDTYKVIKERGVIKINEYVQSASYVLQYISDGTACNAATQVDPYAIKTIDSYLEWYFDEKGKCGGAGEFKFNKQRQILRSRKSDLTIDGIKRSIQQAYGSR
jgi:hypothetical protein